MAPRSCSAAGTFCEAWIVSTIQTVGRRSGWCHLRCRAPGEPSTQAAAHEDVPDLFPFDAGAKKALELTVREPCG